MLPSARLSVLVLALAVVWGCATQQDSVRMLTFNAQLLPGSDDDETRSAAIAARINAADYDVVVLNEVFDEEARDTFVNALSARFPNYIAYIGDDAVGSEDSGLMLFSRFPFEALPNASHRVEADDVVASNAGADWKDVAFIEYDDDVFPDNWAAKGAAMVRIRNPYTGRVYNVAFSHMQASYPEDEDDHDDWMEPIKARDGQFSDLRKVLEGSLLPGQLARDDTFVLGDLNVDGDLADPDLGSGGHDKPNLFEWRTRFSTPGTFFTDVMRDAWATEQSAQDRGLTNMYHWGPQFSPEQGARLDYFLRNRPPENSGVCVQHMTLAHNMRSGTPTIESGFGQAGPTELSDHIGINIDVNAHAPHCSPPTAHANPPLDVWVSGAFTHPGSVQWYRFDKPGTYAFAVQGKGADFRVYSAEDMSTPVPQYYEETIEFTALRGQRVSGKKYSFTKPPYFVKVYRTSRTAKGTHDFIAHRADCSSRNEACTLHAFRPVDQILPAAPLGTDDTVWFEFHTQSANSGLAQNLLTFADAFAPDRLELKLLADDGVTVVAEDLTAAPDPAQPGKWRLEVPSNDVGPSKFYLTVKRRDLSVPGFRIGWETNLTILHGQSVGVPGAVSANLYCVVETDGIFDIDEISLTVKVDGTTVVDDVYIGEYDNGSYRTMEDYLGSIGYLNQVEIILRDEDGGASGDDDYLTTTITPLPAGVTEKLGETAVLECCDGKYLLRFNRSRGLQK